MQNNRVVFEEEHLFFENRVGVGARKRLLVESWDLGPVVSASSTEQNNTRQDMRHAVRNGRKVSVRPDPRYPSEAERYEHNATHLPFRS